MTRGVLVLSVVFCVFASEVSEPDQQNHENVPEATETSIPVVVNPDGTQTFATTDVEADNSQEENKLNELEQNFLRLHVVDEVDLGSEELKRQLLGDLTAAKKFEILEQLAQKGISEYIYQLAEGYLFGDHPTGKNITAAIEKFQKAADLGHPDAQHMIALFYDLGYHGTPKDSAKALLYHTFAAEGQNPESQLVLANLFLNGIGVKAGCHKAAFFLNKVADRVVDELESNNVLIGDRMIRLNEDLDHIKKQEEEDLDIMDFYHYSAENGDVRAQSTLGSLYLKGGHGLPPNPALAKAFLEMAVDSGDVNAYGSLGQMFLQGKGVKANNETAYSYFQKGAKKGHGSSLNGLGFMHLHGYGVDKNVTLALEYFRKGAERGNTEAQYNLGLLYMDSEKQGAVKQDFAKALRYFSLATQAGHTLSTFHLAQMHLNGLGTSANCPLAMNYLKQVVEKGPWVSVMSVALDKYRSEEFESSLLLYLDAAQQGFEVATFNAAYLLHQTEPAKIDFSQLIGESNSKSEFDESVFSGMKNVTEQQALALALFERSAKSGNTEAYIYIGDMHYYGQSVPQDFERAAECYRLAAEARHPQALYNIGFMHQHGLGLAKDFHMAKRNFDLVGSHHRGSIAVAYTALALLFAQWGFEIAMNSPIADHADSILIGGLVFMLVSVLAVLVMRRNRRRQG